MNRFLDPRTKLALLVTLPTFLMGGAGGASAGPFLVILPLIPLVLLLQARRIRQALFGVVVFFGVWGLWRLAGLYLSGGVYLLCFILYGIVMGLIPCVLMAVYAVTTTTVSAFIAALSRLHIPDLITIPLSVMFRFFPIVGEEVTAVNNAMRMRGLRMGNTGPVKMLEYRIIPVLMCCLRIGDELSASALIRGLGAGGPRTNICRIGFHLQDGILLAICAAAFGCWLLSALGVALW